MTSVTWTQPEIPLDRWDGEAHTDHMSNTASEKQIAFYTSLVRKAAALDTELAALAQVALDAFPNRTREDASQAITRAQATLARLEAARPTTVAAAAPVVSATIDLSTIPAGNYAVPGGDTRLKVEIDRPTKGRWAGFVFVKDAAVYGDGQRYGVQAPGETYKGKIQDALRTIAADPKAASAAYGHLTSTCGRCRRPLEDAESVARGIGPVCAGKGW